MLEATRRVLAEGRPHAGIELLFTPKEEVGLVGAYAFDHRRLRAQDRLRLRPGGADRHRHPRRAVLAVARGDVPRPRLAFRACTRRRDGRRSPPPRARSRSSGSAASTRTRPRTSARSPAARRRTSFPSGARSSPRRARTTSGSSRELVQEMQDAITFAAGVAECDVETKARKSYRGYRFGAHRSRDRARCAGARALRPRGRPTTARAAPRTRTCSTSAVSRASTSRTA